MPNKVTDLELKKTYRSANFNHLVGLAEKLMNSLAKRVQQAEDAFK